MILFFLFSDQTINPPQQQPSNDDINTARLALELSIGLGNSEGAVLGGWLFKCWSYAELLRRGALQNVHASLLIRERVEAYNDEVHGENRRRADGWEVYKSWMKAFESHEILVEQEHWTTASMSDAQTALTMMYSCAAKIDVQDDRHKVDVFIIIV